jgi:hypothetical protein
MSKVITFSRYFQSNHPRKGEPTYFVEKIWKSFELNNLAKVRKDFSEYGMTDIYYRNNFSEISPKHHTIRSGNRFKVGDKFSPRVWSGKPYKSKQIILAQDIEIKKVWNIGMDENCVFWINEKYLKANTVELLAKNDGLEISDFYKWFMPNYNKPKLFSGQIICWDDTISY